MKVSIQKFLANYNSRLFFKSLDVHNSWFMNDFDEIPTCLNIFNNTKELKSILRYTKRAILLMSN